MTKLTVSERNEAKEYLLETLQKGDTIYAIIKHVSTSGMYRVIDLYTIKDNKPIRLSWNAAKLLEGYDRKHEGCKASGCGMDMCFHLIHNLGYALFDDGYAFEYSYLG